MGPRSRELLGRVSLRRLRRRVVPVRHEPRGGASGRPWCGPPGSPTWASSVGSSTCPPSSPRAVYGPVHVPARPRGGARPATTPSRRMRLEKGYRAFARELTPRPGRSKRSDLRLQAARRRRLPRSNRRGAGRRAVPASGWSRSWSTTRLPTPGAGNWCCATAARSGQVTSAAWGAALGAPVGLALVGDRFRCRRPRWVRSGRGRSTWRVSGYPLSVSLRAPFDPAGTRLGRRDGGG